MKAREISVTVNARRYRNEVPPRLTLLDYLREVLGLTGTHAGCEHGVCGACSVIFDGQPIRSCLMFAIQADGHEVETVEGLAGADGGLSPLQDAFWEAHALQCGYCTPGMLMASHALLRANPEPTEDEIKEAIGGNLCRCTGYRQIVEAVRLAAKRMRGADPEAGKDTVDE
ncbi:MAG: (2Fe-2S)-binding protein [Proteobacteria bacterium]|nr:(2Fe-2S)-binding protein [Pseudomonadota bacterium]